ncbi:YqzG/YhdC family protein [Aneurinibacillus migulanus]|uniref:YqzG/YhdC family protein n=1 Tax=Aneurinibacillus migulanus TaxID=47500 RepID=UPI00209E552B|nr:YqzG/YhdC family protein [Aneurinibacillus migulanus]MCP1357237.1 YqzG/YhdC family protein [Aneurinibacillus migulanus]
MQQIPFSNKLFLVFILAFLSMQPAFAESPYAKPEPAYAKWGSMAMVETRKKYPSAKIVDYLHVGRTNISSGVAEEKFKLWLNQGEREWGVYVTISFETETDKPLSITFKETDR